jgi:predicted ABC-type ATPase
LQDQAGVAELADAPDSKSGGRKAVWVRFPPPAPFVFMAPSVYIIAGPNGAGKTTFAKEFLPNYANCKNFVNADMIAQGISPFAPDAAAFRAGRLMLQQIREYAKRNESFGFETTLSGRGYEEELREFASQGYVIHIFYLWIPNIETSLERIRLRVAEGGHDIPEDAARRRFSRSLTNFMTAYRRLTDFWILFDNSLKPPAVIALKEQDAIRIIDSELFERLSAEYGHR